MRRTRRRASGTPDLSVLAAGDVIARIEDLRVSFPVRRGAVAALRSVSLEIRSGEVLALVGESGSGKTVLALSVLGLLPAFARPRVEGRVEVAGVDMLSESGSSRAVRSRLLGAVFQDPLNSLNPTMRIRRQLTERGIGEERALQNLRRAGVPEPDRRARQFPHELSGGLRQRVMIAMALGTNATSDPRDVAAAVQIVSDRRGAPRLIVADEPTTALDVSVQAQILLLFDGLRREHGCALLFVTHDLGVAASIADRVAVLYAGRLCEVGPVTDVLTRPTHPYTRALLDSRLSVGGQVHAVRPIRGEPPSPLALPPGCAFAPRCPRAQADCTVSPPDLTPSGEDVAREVACLHPHTDHDEARSPGPSIDVPGPPRVDDRRGTAALELRDVSKTFRLGKDLLHAVSNVDLVVPAHGSVALVGESGCGKTTTLRLATGLIAPDSGSVHWPGDAGRPQLIFQDASSSLTPWMTVESQIAELLARREVPHAGRRTRTLELLDLVGLDERVAESKPRHLSGGQRQRAAIARALACEPRVLVCDEPVSALDASLVVRVLGLLESLRQRLGTALLVVSHDLAVARRIADTIAVMYRGRIVEWGPADRLFAHPAHPYTKGLVAALPTTEPKRLAPMLAGEPPSAVGEIPGCDFHPRCPYARDRCAVDRPLLLPVGSDRASACHFSEEVLRDERGRRGPTGIDRANGVPDARA